MNSLYANARNETERLWRRRKTKGFALVAALLPLLSVWALNALPEGALQSALGSDLTMLMLRPLTLVLIPLFLMMTAADLFAGEAADGTLKLTLLRPITRAKVYASKIYALSLFAAALLAIGWTVSTTAGVFVVGAEAADGLAESLKAYAVSLLPMVAIGLLASIVGLLVRSVAGAMATMLLVYLAAGLLPFLFPQASVWSVVAYAQWHVRWSGSGAPVGSLVRAAGILLAYCIMAYTAGVVLLERKQL
ncbi:ABC transporter permease [Cohnella hashimotonis]|uniref:ABC transporter permease n=1 Tax=Cohnella hashimotonis TaxID=2826895 RepID=A0ABT6TEQ8_9BACL|nr:ABC transporter permease [Cohnella hashimotonis]MDI4645239.1 ABC transporter permease [Cohnella hashimotonis]